MKTIWFYGKNKEDEEILTSLAEIIGEALINRNKSVEIIVQSEIQEILGRGLKDTDEDRSTFADRLGFLGNLLHRNNIFALIISCNAPVNDRKLVKENHGNYLQVSLDSGDSLTDILLDKKNDLTVSAKEILEYLINKGLVPEQSQTIYSEDEEEEIRKRLEDLGYV